MNALIEQMRRQQDRLVDEMTKSHGETADKSKKNETLTIRLDPEIRERLDAAIASMPYRVTVTSVVERGLNLAINEIEMMMNAASGNDGEMVGFMLRIPEGLRDRIKAAAKENGRSMNTEIIRALTAMFPAE